MSQTVELKRTITAMEIQETKTAINQGQSKCEMPRKKPSTILDLQIINILIICFLELFAEIEKELTSGYIALLTFKQNEKKMLDLDFKIKTLRNEFNDLFDQNKELKKKMCAVLK